MLITENSPQGAKLKFLVRIYQNMGYMGHFDGEIWKTCEIWD